MKKNTLSFLALVLLALSLVFPAHTMELPGTKRKAEETAENTAKKTKKEPMITIDAKDNKTVEVEKSIALLSPTLREVIEQLASGRETNNTIPLPEFDADTLSIIFKTLKAIDRFHTHENKPKTLAQLIAHAQQSDVEQLRRALNTQNYRALFANNQALDRAINYLDLPLLGTLRSVDLVNNTVNVADIITKKVQKDVTSVIEQYVRTSGLDIEKIAMAEINKPLDKELHKTLYTRGNALRTQRDFEQYLSRSYNGIITIVDPNDGKAISNIDVRTQFPHLNDQKVGVSSDSQKFAFIHEDQMIIMDRTTQKIIKRINAADLGLSVLSLQKIAMVNIDNAVPHNTTLFILNPIFEDTLPLPDDKAHIVDMVSGKIVTMPGLRARGDNPETLINMDRYVITISDGCNVNIFDTVTGLIKTMTGYIDPQELGYCWQISKDYKYLVLFDWDESHALYVWDLEPWFAFADYFKNKISLSQAIELKQYVNDPQLLVQKIQEKIDA